MELSVIASFMLIFVQFTLILYNIFRVRQPRTALATESMRVLLENMQMSAWNIRCTSISTIKVVTYCYINYVVDITIISNATLLLCQRYYIYTEKLPMPMFKYS